MGTSASSMRTFPDCVWNVCTDMQRRSVSPKPKTVNPPLSAPHQQPHNHKQAHPLVRRGAPDLDRAEQVPAEHRAGPRAGPVRLGDAALAARDHPGGQALARNAARGREAPQLPPLSVQDAEVREEAVLLVGRVEERLLCCGGG